ncbi:MAG: cytochrome c oxidase accessory protein CcoG [Phycisphaerales bacterium JB063]
MPPNTPPLLESEEHVLSTLERDGSRRWLRPKLSKGKFLTYRRYVAYGLIALFTLLPYIRINGHPAILLDVIHRDFYIFGGSFRPTDSLLLALLMLTTGLTIFLVTALLGRVWCGWACPQTVYMEFVFRPIERLFDGRKGIGGKPAKPPAPWRTAAKYVVFFLICVHLAHIFMAYFVGVDQLFAWSRGNPLNHPFAFVIIFAIVGLMMFDFCFFREQLCIVACPYGRLQSVMIDKRSMIISYDPSRGEPRGKLGRKKRDALADKDKPEHERTVSLDIMQGYGGDCIDCHECVTTCPTGIDIREGLQLECIGCAQCIDACNPIMDRIGRPHGLIRYTSQEAIEGKHTRILRPRVLLYPAIILAVASLFLFLLITKPPADVTMMRQTGTPFMTLDSGLVQNTMRLKIVNRDEREHRYTVSVKEPPGVSVRMVAGDAVTLAAGQSYTEPIHVLAAPDMFRDGRLSVVLTVTDGEGFSTDEAFELKGPWQQRDPQPQPNANTPTESSPEEAGHE